MQSPRVTAVLLIGLVVGLYWPTLSYGFVYEDWNDPERFMQPFSLWAIEWTRLDRMATGWTFGLSAALSPREPWGYHAVSVGLHALNTVLLFAIGRQVWTGLWWPFVCAAVFAVHPIQTESVAYISARADLVMTTGVLVALLGAERERWGWMLTGCVLAVMGKESGIVATPLALVWALGRGKALPPWLFGSAVIGGLALTVWLALFHGLGAFDLAYTAQETAKLWHLLGLLVWPVGLSIDHDYGQWPTWWPAVTLVGTLLVSGLALISERAWAFGWSFLVIALAPRLLTPLVEGLHEHHLVTPMVGLSLALVASLAKGVYVNDETGNAALPA